MPEVDVAVVLLTGPPRPAPAGVPGRLAGALRRRLHRPAPRLRRRRLRLRSRGDPRDAHRRSVRPSRRRGQRAPRPRPRRQVGPDPRRARAPAPAQAAAAALPGIGHPGLPHGDPRCRRGRGRPLEGGRALRHARADAGADLRGDRPRRLRSDGARAHRAAAQRPGLRARHAGRVRAAGRPAPRPRRLPESGQGSERAATVSIRLHSP